MTIDAEENNTITNLLPKIHSIKQYTNYRNKLYSFHNINKTIQSKENS